MFNETGFLVLLYGLPTQRSETVFNDGHLKRRSGGQ